jgi:hypothetical protein
MAAAVRWTPVKIGFHRRGSRILANRPDRDLDPLPTSVAAPSIGHAQTFKVEKFDIKGQGGTDYVAVEAATGRGFNFANHMTVVEGATGKVLAVFRSRGGKRLHKNFTSAASRSPSPI